MPSSRSFILAMCVVARIAHAQNGTVELRVATAPTFDNAGVILTPPDAGPIDVSPVNGIVQVDCYVEARVVNDALANGIVTLEAVIGDDDTGSIGRLELHPTEAFETPLPEFPTGLEGLMPPYRSIVQGDNDNQGNGFPLGGDWAFVPINLTDGGSGPGENTWSGMYKFRWSSTDTTERQVMLDVSPVNDVAGYWSTDFVSMAPAAGSAITINVVPPPVISQSATAVPHELSELELTADMCPAPGFGELPVETDPIRLYSGEFYLNVVDMRISGRGTDFVWARKYMSKNGVDTLQGNGWDFSYNMRVESDGADLIVHNGWGRRDKYTFDAPSGKWSRSGFFRELEQMPDGSYELMLADKGKWTFAQLNGAPDEGKVTAVTDRNGNTIAFTYDAQGRLSQIADTLDSMDNPRRIDVAYDANGMIASVTDFTGRQVSYEYYDGIEPGGNLGDLKSVTTPVVVGTPNGNDYPSGKTTTYTYSTGAPDARLNHNLLTITDPKGQTYLQNEYATTTDPAALEFDRVVRQRWGEPDDIIDLVYEEVTPAPANGNATIRTVLNDRQGHVKEVLHDAANRRVIYREYTGRWDPDQPTTSADLVAPTTLPLRATDPLFFETRWEYNADSLITRLVEPNGNERQFVYDAANPDPRARGNLLMRIRTPGSHTPAGDQAQIIETYEYDDGLGGCCGTNFVTSYIDGRGNETTHAYDDRGNRTQTIHRINSIVEDFEYNDHGQIIRYVHPDNGSNCRRVDTYTYYETGPSTGYLQQRVIDDGSDAEACATQSHHNLTTIYEYDARGNLTRAIDARGNDDIYEFNALDQVVRQTRRPVMTPSGERRYETLSWYDANDNLVRQDIENVDDAGDLGTNTHFTTIFEYEILNNLTRECRESGDYTGPFPGDPNQPSCIGLAAPDLAQFIVVEYEYDANRNRVLTRFGEATNGNQPDNIIAVTYDERDLVFRSTLAAGHPDQSTTQFDYDANRNRVQRIDGLEDVAASRISTSVYDGYNRLIETIDAMGNHRTTAYDANNNVVGLQIHGEHIDIPGEAANIRLFENAFDFDEMDRMIAQRAEFFDTLTQTPVATGLVPDGIAETTYTYNDSSRRMSKTNDNGHTSMRAYDAVGRLSLETDAKGNTAEFVYDANSNITQIIETELPDLPGPAEVYTTTRAFDGLDRLVSTEDNVGNTMSHAHDSRSNVTSRVDALMNETRMVYDGVNRPTMTIQDLDDDGADGDGSDIVTTMTWDASSRLIGRGDDNANVLATQYDPLNRPMGRTYADGTAESFVYDVHHNRVTQTDANGSTSTHTYDRLNRLISNTIMPGAGVSTDTMNETLQYDGLSRLVTAEDDDSRIDREYDSLSSLTSETLTIDPGLPTESVGTVASRFDALRNRRECTYPGGRSIVCGFDALERISTIDDGATGSIASFDYIGRSRLARRTHANGTRLDRVYDGIANDPGDFGVRRVVRTQHTFATPGDIDDRVYAWDRMGNKTSRVDVRAGGPQYARSLTYDDAYRLVASKVEDPVLTLVGETTYNLDGVGNRTSVQAVGVPGTGAYLADPTAPAPADRQTNQYTATSFDRRSYDDNGNLVRTGCLCDRNADGVVDVLDILNFLAQWFDSEGSTVAPGSGTDIDGSGDVTIIDLLEFLACWFDASGCPNERVFEYDYRNRMVRYAEPSGGTDVTYAYDALGRRIKRTVVAPAPTETRYFYDGLTVCEEQDDTGATLATYVYGRYVDDVITMRRGGVDYYYHTDDQHSVVAITDQLGAVVERYEYDDYGQRIDPVTLQPIDTPSLIDNPYRFHGRRFDPESGLYYFRTRYFEPAAGRFTTRDAIGIWGDTTNNGNGYVFTGLNPWSRVDPLGYGWLDNAIDWLDDTASSVGQAIEVAADAIVDTADAIVDGAMKVKEKVDEVIDDVAEFAQEVAEEVEDVVEVVKHLPDAIYENTANGSTASALGGYFDALVESFLGIDLPDIGPSYGQEDAYYSGRAIGKKAGVTMTLVTWVRTAGGSAISLVKGWAKKKSSWAQYVSGAFGPKRFSHKVLTTYQHGGAYFRGYKLRHKYPILGPLGTFCRNRGNMVSGYVVTQAIIEGDVDTLFDEFLSLLGSPLSRDDFR